MPYDLGFTKINKIDQGFQGICNDLMKYQTNFLRIYTLKKSG